MASPASCLVHAAGLMVCAKLVSAQQAVLPPDQFLSPTLPGITANGMLLAQNDPAVDRARLQRDLAPPVSIGVDANGTAVAATEPTDSEDDSFGAQLILKQQERMRSFIVTGGVSVNYTNNVALTRRDEQDDVFAVANAGLGWSRRIAPALEANIGAHVSVFRYDRTPELDFHNLGFGAGFSWSPKQLRGFHLFGRYDFTELLDGDGDEILREHALTIGLQKNVPLGRSHGFAFGFSGTLGLAEPEEAERSQIGAFIGYNLKLTRSLEAGFLVRPALHFYTDSGRIDFNQILSWTLRHRFSEWADVNAAFSYGVNRSEHATFDYNVLTTGAGAVVSIRF